MSEKEINKAWMMADEWMKKAHALESERDALKADLESFKTSLRNAVHEISKLKGELLLKLSDDEKIKEAVFLEADRWRAKENKCIDGLRASIKTLEGIADKYQSRAAKYRSVLEKINNQNTEYKEVDRIAKEALKDD